MGRKVIVHSGVKGMRWGVRRWTDPDGNLNAAGIRRYMENNPGSNRSGYSKSNPNGKPLAGAGRNSQTITPADRYRMNTIRKNKWTGADSAVRANPSYQNRNASRSLYPVGYQNDKPDEKKYKTGYDNVNKNGYQAKYQAGNYDNKNAGIDYKLGHLKPVKGYEDYKRTWDKQREYKDIVARNKYEKRSDVQERTAKAKEIAKARQAGENTRKAISGAVNNVVGAAKNAYNDASKLAGNVAKDVSGAAKNAYNSASNVTKDAVYGKQTTITRGALEGNTVRRGGVVNAAKNTYNTASELVGNTTKDVSKAVSGAADRVSDVASESFNKAKGFINGFLSKKNKKKNSN